MDMASDKQQLLTKKIREFASSTRPRSVSMEEKKITFIIVLWHFLKEEKWSLMLSEVGNFQYH